MRAPSRRPTRLIPARRACAMAALAVACCCGKDTTAPGIPDLALSTATLSFSALSWAPVSATFRLENVGSAPLRIDSIIPSQPWITLQPAGGTEIGVGAQSFRQVTVYPEGLVTGAYEGSLRIFSTDPDSPETTVAVVLTVGAYSGPSISVNPSRLQFRVQYCDSAVARLLVTNPGHWPLVVDSIVPDASWVQVTPDRSVHLESGGMVYVDVRITTWDLIPQLYAATIAFHSTDLEHPVVHVAVELQMSARPAGSVVWTYPTTGFVYSSPAIGPDRTMYIGSDDGFVYAMDYRGRLRWRFQTGGPVCASPAIGWDGTVYAPSDNGVLYAMDSSGSLRWSCTVGAYLPSSPALGPDETIYLGGSDGALVAVGPAGSIAWRYVTGGPIASSPAVGTDGTIYVGSADSCLHAITPQGMQRWCFRTGAAIRSSPALGADGTVYFGSDDKHLYAVSRDGGMWWRVRTGGPIRSSPAIDTDGTVYVGCDDEHVYAIDSEGSLRWSYRPYQYWPVGTIRSSPALHADGFLVVGTDGGYLCALRSDGTLAWTSYPYRTIGSSPAIDGTGMVYFATQSGTLAALSSGSLHGLAGTPWPKFRHDNFNTGRAGS